MKTTLKKEIPLIAIVLLPIIYLTYIWKSLPSRIPIHWNIDGEIDGWGGKNSMLLFAVVLPVVFYLLFLVLPKIDPKKKIEKMGSKFYAIKFILSLFISLLALFFMYSARNQSLANPSMILIGIGVLFTIFGNYFKTFRPNYFIGIRTPWTLSSDTVWKVTHELGGKLWFGGGLLIVILGLILPSTTFFIVFLCITAIISIVPIVQSYMLFKREKNGKVVD